ncbi:unnamed protein product [Urochloa humidicola]
MVVLETAAILSIAGWAASPVINRLIGKARSYAAKKYKWHQGGVTEKQLESVAHFLDEISSTVSLVEERRIANDPNMFCWLSQLKGAIDEVEDMFDLLDYEILKSSLPDTSHSSRHASGSAEPTGSGTTAGLFGTAESFTKCLETVLKKLDDIRQSSRGLVQASLLAASSSGSGRSGGASASWRPVTGPLLPEEPLGYDDQYEHLVTRLLLDVNNNLQAADAPPHAQAVAVAIVGHGGMGKTTLAQQACNDPRVLARFDLVIWAWVYGKSSEADLLGEIWASAAEARDAADTSFASLAGKLARLDVSGVWNALVASAAPARHGEMMSFGSKQRALEKLVSSRRYLLVLDDMCSDEAATELRRREAWSSVLAPFRHGKRGSRVLVTTRAKMCARILGAGASRRIHLDGIPREPFIRLLKRSASLPAGDELDEVLSSSGFFSSSASASPPWKGSPLVAKEMGLKLRSTRDRSNWEEILSTDCHENAIACHVSSYQDLPPHLQCCFAFLSLFPNGFMFQPEILLKMWVAHGFINDDGSKTMEDTARRYFNDLLSRSLLQEKAVSMEGTAAKTTRYVIHEHIHSMIRSVSANYFLMLQGTNFSAKKIPLTIRHLSVTTGCLLHLRKHGVLKRLRTLLVFRDLSSPSPAIIDEDIIKELTVVRVLDLTGTDNTDLPQGISSLIHLRYLALPDTIKSFPIAVTKLLHLQTLIGGNDGMDLGVPFEFCAKKANLGLLSGMNSLRGSLSITSLDAVASKEDAQKAQLRNKKYVTVLKFEWDAKGAILIPDLDVLEALQPHDDLQVLHIRRYRGPSSPNWLSDNRLQRLTHLYMVNCRKWEVLPPFGHLPRLKHLQIEEMNDVQKIDGSGLFKSLETLVLSDMKSLVEWTTGTSDSGFTILKRIEILYCPKLEKLPTMPTALKSSKIRGCPQLLQLQ